MDEREKVRIHIMHSMKGGCGKSTCALFKTLMLANASESVWGREDVLLIDADFRGSALQKLLFRITDDAGIRRKPLARRETADELLKKRERLLWGNGIRHQIAVPDKFSTNKTLSHYLRGTISSSRDITYHTFSYTQEEGNGQEIPAAFVVNGWFDVILSAQAAECKDWFRDKQGKISGGIFAYRMENLLDKLLMQGALEGEENGGRGQYADIVIDMPPGYDEYSDILLEVLRKCAARNDRLELHYYAVTTEDIGHMALTKENIKSLQRADTKYKPLDSVNLILNSISQVDFEGLNDKAMKDYRECVGDKGYVYRNEYAPSYHKFCRGEDATSFEQGLDKMIKIQE